MSLLTIAGFPRPLRVVRHASASRRLRLEVPGLLGRRRAARELEERLRALDGVEETRVDARSGRALLRYAAGSELLRGLQQEPEGAGRAFVRSRPSRRSEAPAWHALESAEVMRRLEGPPPGLDPAEVERRRRRFGANALGAPRGRSALAIWTEQLANLPTALLGGSAALSALAREWTDAAAILSAIGLDSGIGFAIEQQTEGLLRSWQRHEAGRARVLRAGRMLQITASELVPGDILMCRSGYTVAADARLIETHRLACDESMLTGESEPCEKDAAAVAADAPLAERSCMLYAGTTLASGRGRAVVVATGPDTEIARIRRLLEEQQAPETPFERRFRELSRDLSLLGAGAGLFSATLGLLRFQPVGQVLRDAVALGVAAIPEGLPLVSTAALVQSMRRLRERGMLVRRIASAETLGSVTVVCADKTGTLTRNEMRLECLDLGRGSLPLEELRAAPGKPLEDPPTLALLAAVLNSDVDVESAGGEIAVAGSATERALVTAAAAAGLDRQAVATRFPRRRLLARDHDRPYVVTHHRDGDAELCFVKGAPEAVLELCDRDLYGPLTPERRRERRARNEAMAGDGLRVLGLAWRPPEHAPGSRVRPFVWIGMVGLRDPLRADAAGAVRAAREAGIRTLILTGDQRATAVAVARQVGLSGEVVNGPELARRLAADGEEVRERLAGIACCARVTPADKAEIVQALRAAGEVVAMAGDGINDAPALKVADVGIAIGHRASGVSRQAADIMLAGEELEAILSAVAEGRIVQDNLRRAVRYLLATNLAELVIPIGSQLVGGRSPFSPAAMLWINLISDSLPVLAIALEPGRGDELSRPPAAPGAALLSREDWGQVLRHGRWISALGAAGLVFGGPATAFSALAGAEIGYALACRSDDGPPDERTLRILGATAGLHTLTWLLPPLRAALRLPPALALSEVAGFGVGALAPWCVDRVARFRTIRRRGGDAIHEEVRTS